jgi:hypothetical protein
MMSLIRIYFFCFDLANVLELRKLDGKEYIKYRKGKEIEREIPPSSNPPSVLEKWNRPLLSSPIFSYSHPALPETVGCRSRLYPSPW